MPPTKKDETALSPELLKAVQVAATAEQEAAEVREPPPDFVEIDGVRYYRSQAAANGERISHKKDEKTGEPYQWVTLDLAPHANEIRLDGVRYLHGQSYEVRQSVARTMIDIAARTWDHERQTGGANILAGGRTAGRGFHVDAGGGVSSGARA